MVEQTWPARIQLCGRLSIEVAGRTYDAAFSSAQLQRVFAFLVLNRAHTVTRDQLADAVWGGRLPAAPEGALSALFSRLRAALGPELAGGRGVPVVRLPAGALVDVERATVAVHDAESGLARGEPASAYVSAAEARYITERMFLPGHDLPWIDDRRRLLDDVNSRALEAHARAALDLGGSERSTADRASARLVEKLPFRESAHALRMEVLAATGDVAEALLVYERLRARLVEQLGVSPGPELRSLHQQLLVTTRGG